VAETAGALPAPAPVRGLHPGLRPKDAATLIILDRDGTEPKVLMGRRNSGHVFMPGKFVFPGGRVDVGDGRGPASDEFDAQVAAKLMTRLRRGAGPNRARAFALAAVRETYEEAGLLIGRRTDRPIPPAGPWAAFAERGIAPALSAFRFLARAITPPGRPRRFDARFFVVDDAEIGARLESPAGPSGEFDALAWLTLSETLALELPAITRIVLDELKARLSSADGLEPGAPVPFYFMRHGRFVRDTI
jgi:8-oxo-dGTP pyrophosphatase MutT (NUDIX family)